MSAFELQFNRVSGTVQLNVAHSRAASGEGLKTAFARAVAHSLEKEKPVKPTERKNVQRTLFEHYAEKVTAKKIKQQHVIELALRHLPPAFEEDEKMTELLMSVAFHLKREGHVGPNDSFAVKP
ncbi:hypothetical protein HYV43_02550 [Candidatus Micrarchaeota archaeon]|nr:hypothetical protein [Candidatus Micrarchaeota archaeon]